MMSSSQTRDERMLLSLSRSAINVWFSPGSWRETFWGFLKMALSHWSSVRLAKTSPSAFLCFGLGEFVEVYRAANQIEFVVTIFH